MRANPIARPHRSRRAYARSNSRSFFGVRAPQDEDGHRVLQSSPYKQPISFPRRISAPGVLHRCFTHPESRGGRSAEKRSGACEAPVGRIMTRYARRLARRLASHNAGRSPLGAPPWRFWAPGAALPSPWAPAVLQRRAGALRIRAASSSHPGRSAWRAGSRTSRGERLRATRRRTPLPAPPSGSSPETPLMSEDANFLA